MRFTNSLLLAASTVGLVAAQGNATSASSYASCASRMDGQLPNPTPVNFDFSGNVRRYYIAAELVDWDYAPTGWDNYMGLPLSQSPRAQYQHFGGRYTYTKALYRGYTDSSFTELTEQTTGQGTLGPTLRSEVGDLIEIMFVNKVPNNYMSMHSMGLAYTKYSEGGDYPNNTVPGVPSAFVPTEAVAPGDCVVYKWMVENGAGPEEGALSKAHAYHSYVTFQRDSNAGLIGPSYVYRRGEMDNIVNNYREFPILYMNVNEDNSWLSALNQGIDVVDPDPNGSGGNYSIYHPQLVNMASSGHGGSTFMSMNGYILANNPTFEMCYDDKVIWYVYAYGSASHVFHMHGNAFEYDGRIRAVMSVNDGEQFSLPMNATGAGQWQVICHVANHNANGMEANYRVYFPGSDCPLPPPRQANLPSGTASPLPSTTPSATATITGINVYSATGEAQSTADAYGSNRANPTTTYITGAASSASATASATASASASGSQGSSNGQGSNNGASFNQGPGPNRGPGGPQQGPGGPNRGPGGPQQGPGGPNNGPGPMDANKGHPFRA